MKQESVTQLYRFSAFKTYSTVLIESISFKSAKYCLHALELPVSVLLD